jgi:hypothetical protein
VATFAARKRGKKRRERGSGKKASFKKIKNKVCKEEKGFYLCSPKTRGRKKGG